MPRPSGDLPAFPIASDIGGHFFGISRRDYFAAKAMQALVMRGELDRHYTAARSFEIADAMIAKSDGE